MSSPALKTSLFALGSAVICGLINAVRCPQLLDATCPIAALQAFGDSGVSPLVWLDWVNWLPGLVFGALVSLSALDWRQVELRSRSERFLFFSGVIYLLVGPLFSAILIISQGWSSEGLAWLLPAGLLAGLSGAASLAIIARRIFQPARGFIENAMGAGSTGLIGGIAGLAFVTICFYGGEMVFPAWPLAFAVWQVPVAVALRRQIV